MRTLRKSAIAILLSVSASGHAADLGQVTITNITVGPAHGAMMQVNGSSWVCLDPEAQYMTAEKSKRLYAFVLSQYMTQAPIRLWVLDGAYATACGNGYPVVQEVRAAS